MIMKVLSLANENESIFENSLVMEVRRMMSQKLMMIVRVKSRRRKLKNEILKNELNFPSLTTLMTLC